MVNRNKIVAGVSLALVAFGLWFFLPGRERQVKRHLNALSAWAAKGGDEGDVAAIQNARQAKEFFADPCAWSADGYGLSGKFSIEEIQQAAYVARARYGRFSLKFYDTLVDFDSEGRASVTATARIEGESVSGEPVHETHEVRCLLVKGDAGWRLTKVAVVQVLRR